MSDTMQPADKLPVTPPTPTVAMLRTLGLIAALAGFLVVLTYQVTTPMIEENKRQAIERALYQVLPGAESRRDFILDAAGIRPADAAGDANGTRLYAGYDADGKLVGVALEAAAQGYQDIIRVLYGYDPACQCIRGIQVLKMAETPGIGDKIAKDPRFLANFEALDARVDEATGGLSNAIVAVKSGKKTQTWQIDAISGATISSNAVARMLDTSAQSILPQLRAHLDRLTSPSAGGRQ
ncbi:MAG: FMN-binding protein [Gammaproteobacteria bacterium]|nr:FMN-binding protein [Gammaproteobacteria bacterium]